MGLALGLMGFLIGLVNIYCWQPKEEGTKNPIATPHASGNTNAWGESFMGWGARGECFWKRSDGSYLIR